MPSIEYLIVGGGAGATGGVSSVNYGSGGAGGQVKTGSKEVTAGIKPVVVGAGSSGVATGTPAQGGSSSFDGVTATGGRGAAHTSRTGGNNDDFSGGTDSSSTNSGGGAGAGANGSGKNGGNGVQSSISGSAVYYAGGGGGGYGGSGGLGGTAFDTHAAANTGAGAGGTSATQARNGGSGKVILRYLTADFGECTGGTKTTDGAYTIHTFNSSADFTCVLKAGGSQPLFFRGGLALGSMALGLLNNFNTLLKNAKTEVERSKLISEYNTIKRQLNQPQLATN